MKRENLKRAQDIIGWIGDFERVISECNNTGILPTVWINRCSVDVPAEHNRFLKRVIRDYYQTRINKFKSELETL